MKLKQYGLIQLLDTQTIPNTFLPFSRWAQLCWRRLVPGKQTPTSSRGQSPSFSMQSQEMATTSDRLQLTILGRRFSSVDEAWTNILTLPDDRRCDAVVEFTRPLLTVAEGADEWLETAFTEVERLKKGTSAWKDAEFHEKWKPVEQRAK